jgi:LuxR family transcriptional regulator, maltose regulon positive regulatory protein
VELFAAKLDRPVLGHEQVRRTSALAKMASSDAKVIAISVAPGYGKTTLLGQWTEDDDRPVAWLSLDRRDNDPVVLLTYLAVALSQVGKVDPRVFRSLRSSTPAIETRVVPRLVQDVTEMAVPMILVLDDVHVINNRASLDALATMILRFPPTVQIAIAGRAEPDLPLPRLRAEGSVMDIEREDLSFSRDEARGLLRAVGRETTEEELEDLVDRTEGWPAGIYLSSLSRQRSSLRHARVVSGNDQYIGEYLRSEFLAHLSDAMTTFLTRSAPLDEMTGPLCDHVLQRHNSARTLGSLARKNLLVLPVHGDPPSFRYHHLFRDLLLAELERREPGLAATLRSRAAGWFEENGDRETALDYAQMAGDADLAARLFPNVAGKAYRSGRLSTVMRWLDWFLERELQVEYPMVSLAGAWVKTLVGEAETALWLGTLAEEHLTDELLADGITPARAWSSVLNALYCRDGVERMDAEAANALTWMPEGGSQRSTAFFVAGAARFLSGDNRAAEEHFNDAIEVGIRTGSTHAAMTSLAELAIIQAHDGDWDAALDSIERGRDLIDQEHVEEYPTSAVLYAVSAHVLAHGHGYQAATDDLIRAQRLRPHLTYSIPWLAVQARLQLGSAYLQLADPAGARTVLREAEAIFRHRPDLGILSSRLNDLAMKIGDAPNTVPGLSTLTSAELRLLPLLATHLSFPELGERLFVSRHTVKSQAISIYRKLGVSSRSDAVQRAADLGLLEP